MRQTKNEPSCTAQVICEAVPCPQISTGLASICEYDVSARLGLPQHLLETKLWRSIFQARG
jgi:hypothetical protein